jgi:Pyruvate/2-oxoacid:ferredoxin oxidoreductase delta subunit
VKRPVRILYCHCAHAEVVPQETRRLVLGAIAASGARAEAVADLCELAAKRDPLLKRFGGSGAGGPVHIVACFPRTVRWLFHWAGVPLPADAAIHNLRTESAEAILQELAPGGREKTGAVPFSRRCEKGTVPVSGPKKGAVPMFPAKKPGEWVPWFPVIDYDRCQNCRQCQQFCLFGVYATDGEGKVRVVNPDHCKTGCPACARICPSAAIIFPKYSDGPINGDDKTPADPARPQMPIDFSSLSNLDLKEAMRRRAAILKARQGTGGGQARQEGRHE